MNKGGNDPKRYEILIVDDTSSSILHINKILQEENYGITFAKSGEEALEILKSRTFDLILLDIIMPGGMNGFEVFGHLKKNLAMKDIPVIFFTQLKEADKILTGIKLGAVDYITKPFNRIEVLSRVKPHLELRRAKAELNRLKETLAGNFKNYFIDLYGQINLLKDNYDNFSDVKKRTKIGKTYKLVKKLSHLLGEIIDIELAED